MITDEVVETVAMAIAGKAPDGSDGLPDWYWHEIVCDPSNRYRDMARAAVAAMPTTASASENERLRAALEKLVKSANEVNRLGASTGPQWLKMTVAIVSAKAALEHT